MARGPNPITRDAATAELVVLSPVAMFSRARAVPRRAGTIVDGVFEFLSPGRRRRRAWRAPGRAHIEVRAVHRPGNERISREIVRALGDVEGVRRVQVNAVLGRVVVEFEPDGPTVDDLLLVIERVEEANGVAHETFPHDRPEYPSDTEPVRREMLELAADVLGLGASVFGQVLRFTPFPIELASVVSLVDSEPRLRRFFEERLGPPVTDLGLGLSNAVVQALSQGPLGLAVDGAHRANLLRESQERRGSWLRREDELYGTHAGDPVPAPVGTVRPAPLPAGPLENYADRAALASLGVAAAALPLTGSPRRAASLVVAGLPKAGRMGRDAFAASFGRQLARRDVVVFDRTALRRFDRIDFLLLDADAVAQEAVLGKVVPMAPAPSATPRQEEERNAGVLRSVAQDLFDERDPAALRTRGLWVLGPMDAVEQSGIRVPPGCTRRARSLGQRDTAVLALAHGDSVRALVVVETGLDALATALVDTATGGGLQVAVAGTRGTTARVASKLGVDALAGGERLHTTVRSLQRDGHAVLLVSAQGPALQAADCGVGLMGSPKTSRLTGPATEGAVPWGADLLTKRGLPDALLVLEGVLRARAVSSHSAMMAAAGSGIGTAWSLFGPAGSAARRAALPVNAAAMAAQLHGITSANALRHHIAVLPRRRPPWHAMDIHSVLAELGTSSDGLSHQAAVARRTVWKREPASLARRLPAAMAAELANPLTPLLGVGAGLAAAVGSVTDAVLVASVMGVNATVGGVQRLRTEVSIERLMRVSTDPVSVRRSGATTPVQRDELVYGDVVELHAGELVPADCRILEAVGCEVDESVLTGESLPVLKQSAFTPGAEIVDRHCMLYEGTTLSTGHALAVVVAVGADTEIGSSLADAPQPPPSGVETRLGAITSVTVPATVASGVVVGAMSFLRGRGLRRAITSGVSLTVAAVPEGLPLLASVAQMSSARRLSKQGAFVRNPRTIEALGRVDTLCFDKTGTLTLGEIEVQRVSDGAVDERAGRFSARSRAVLAAAVRASPEDHDGPHATDRAILVGASDAGVSAADNLGGWQVLGELAFDPVRGYHAVVGSGPGGHRVAVKGAPEVILPRCTSWFGPDGPMPITARVRRRLEAEAERLAQRGLRVLAVAERSSSERAEVGDERVRSMELMGFVGLADSVRPAATTAVADLRAAGIDIVMITGDHPSTARAIANELGILDGRRVVTGAELEDMAETELEAVVDNVSIFARITPKDKVRIVRAYQRVGRIVAMTGDGANDAPAIRLAHAGIALGERGSPAAKEAADLVVVDDRIETIQAAVVEGRAMWSSVRSAIAILVGGNLGEVAFTVGAAALTGASPLNARQLLLVNLLTDMLPAMTIAMQPPAGRTPEMLLREGPEASLGSVLTREIALRASTTAVGAFGAWLIGRGTGTARRASTIGLVALVGTQLGQTAVVGWRSPLVPVSSAASAAALAAIVQTPGISQFFGCTPLGPVGWGVGVGAAASATGLSVVAPWLFARAARARSTVLGEIWDFEAPRRDDTIPEAGARHDEGQQTLTSPA